jgi:hypothetical protein
MSPVDTKPKITPKKLAMNLGRIVYGERPSEIIQIRPFQAVSNLVGEERLLDEVAWLLYFAVDAGVISGLLEYREREKVRQAFFETLRTKIGSSFVNTLKTRIVEYQKAIKSAPKDRSCVGWRFVEFCGLGENVAVALAVTLLFSSTAKQARELVEKYRLAS